MASHNDASIPDAAVPFLKWPGGKRWLAPMLAEVFRHEQVNRYYEPFLGAAALYLQLRPPNAVLSDINEELIRFLKTIRVEPECVVRRVWQWSNDESCYERVRASNPRTDRGRAARFLFLNRTCWGGLFRTNRDGHFNVPFGRSGRSLCSLSRVKKVANCFLYAELHAQDFEPAIECAGKGDGVYVDPPYTGKGENNGFVRYNEKLFRWKDQERLARVCRSARKRGAFVVVSGLHHIELLGLYAGWWKLSVNRYSGVSRTVESRRQVPEVLMFSRKPTLVSGSDNQELTLIAR
jgi:DNA adenine methylase